MLILNRSIETSELDIAEYIANCTGMRVSEKEMKFLHYNFGWPLVSAPEICLDSNIFPLGVRIDNENKPWLTFLISTVFASYSTIWTTEFIICVWERVRIHTYIYKRDAHIRIYEGMLKSFRTDHWTKSIFGRAFWSGWDLFLAPSFKLCTSLKNSNELVLFINPTYFNLF